MIKKVQLLKNGNVKIEYDKVLRVDGDEEITETYRVTSKDRPTSGFFAALNALVPHVVKMCEFPMSDIKDIRVKGAEFTYTKKDMIMGAQILAEKVLHESDVNLELKTPHKIEEPYSEDEETIKLMHVDTVRALKDLQNEAQRFINGERNQTNLFEEDGEHEENEDNGDSGKWIDMPEMLLF